MPNGNDELLLGGEWLPSLMKLSKDQTAAAANLGEDEVRYLTDTYYAQQKQRIRANNQVKAIERAHAGEPHSVLDWLKAQSAVMEDQVKVALFGYAKSKDMGRWLMSVYGIGPVIAAGMLSHIDWTKPTVGHVWRFAGLDPDCKWLGREKAAAMVKDEATDDFAQLVENCCALTKRKSANYYSSMGILGERPNKTNFTAWLAKRPWNASLKTICWKAGQSFVKLQNKPKDIYGKQILIRKAYEIENNDRGRYADQAEIKKGIVAKSTDAWPWYAGCYPGGTTAAYAALASVFEGKKLIDNRAELLQDRKLRPGEGVQMLPPLHVQARACRYGVKLFLSHAHVVGHWLATGNLAPNPYPIEHMGHVHVIPPPNMGAINGLQEAWYERQRRA